MMDISLFGMDALPIWPSLHRDLVDQQETYRLRTARIKVELRGLI